MIAAFIGICGLFFTPDPDATIIRGWMDRNNFSNIVIKRQYTERDKMGYREYLAVGTNNMECDRKQAFVFKHLMYFQIEEIPCEQDQNLTD